MPWLAIGGSKTRITQSRTGATISAFGQSIPTNPGQVCGYPAPPACATGTPTQNGPANVQVPTSLSGPTISPYTHYSNQTLKDCNGDSLANNFYGISACGSYTVLDQNGSQIKLAGLAFDENLVVTDTNSGGTAKPTSGATDDSYHLVDFYASGAVGAALPAGSYTYILQTITYHPTGKTVRINCIGNLTAAITVNDLTSNPNPKGNCHH